MKKNFIAFAGLICLSIFVSACAEETAPTPSQPGQPATQAIVQKEIVKPPETKNAKVSSPLIGDVVKSPLKISGTAQNWYFEATFPIRIEDDKGKVLAGGQAHATEEWTKGGWIPFESELEFDPGTAEKGIIILENDNPSGLPENSESLTMEVKFK
jgi:hypothetical protein